MTGYPENTTAMLLIAPELDETSRRIALHNGLVPYKATSNDGIITTKWVQGSKTNPPLLNKMLRDGLKLPHFDFTYGVQDTLQANYDTISPMGSPEGFNIYNNTQNRVIEFMVKLFAESEEELKDNHNLFWALQSLLVPWSNSTFTYQLPPPKLKLIVSASVYATGYLNNITVTHYDPVIEIKLGDRYLKVAKFVELVCSFTRQALTGRLLPYGNAIGHVDGHFAGFQGLDDAVIL